ncbi:unnamed protein product [Brassicogethes aeneus]|uniref:Integrin alpha-PS2 n=1 Tax=Brassicogethes aeneus TaxID=1431903 RepID=A0A9P0B7C9_BRAAE|nr:unnamed protein product [Brassicogethes aeneus]
MCRYCLMSFIVCLVLANVCLVRSFNLETSNYALFRAPSDNSMFGFTVAIHKERSTPWVLVGAPEQQSVFQRDVERGGAVFKCRSDADNMCEEIPFDQTGNRLMGQQQIDNKTGQWFGATLSASGRTDGPIVACAPRYMWFTKDLNRKDPVGTCYVSNGDFRTFEEYSPCRTIHWGYHRQGSCQAGFSAAINNVGDRLYVGAPGSYYWQGSVYQQSLETRPAVFSTNEGQAKDDDSYMGYSTITGDFQDTGEQGIVVGMPRGAELHGRVLFFTWNLTNYKNISSNKIGSYFGYSLAAADVDGDKKLDLIVGAPMHTEPNNEGKYDVGRVYIFYHASDRYGTFNAVDNLDGFNSKSRFGLSLSTLGDLNQDGYDDFAVGAPYDGLNGRGAVYIYYGSSEGVLLKYGQVIYAEDLKATYPVNTFGFSVTGGMDMNGDDYPDMAVGAYLSDTAFFFRSRPVVRVEAYVKFLTPNNLIDINHKDCRLSNGQQGTCTSIDFCVKYSGKGIPDQIYLNLQYILDSKKIANPRMAFLDYDTNTYNDTMVLQKDRPESCNTKRVYVKSDIRDKLTPLEAEVKYFMSDRYTSTQNEQRDPRSHLYPILDLNLPPSRKDSISIQKNCGPDKICIPDLHIDVTSNVEKYLLGSNTNLEFDVIVSNYGEDAFETTFDLQYPEGIYYKKIENKPLGNILCSPLENRTIQCQIGNPLPSSKIANFRMLFQPFHKEGMNPSYDFKMFVNSTNPEESRTLGDNHKNISIDIWIDSTLELTGVSYPQIVQYNASRYIAEEIKRESDIGPQVIHVYNLRNKGPATIQEAEVFISWPYQTLGDEDFLYLLDQPATIGDIKCERVLEANYKNYELDFHTKSIWERLEIDTNSNEFTSSGFTSGSISKGHSSSGGAHTDVTIEQGSGIRGTVGGGKVYKNQGKVDAEISGSGDGSLVHQRRQNITYTFQKPVDVNLGTEHVKTYWNRTYVNGVPYIMYTNVTTVRDAQGNIVNQYTRTNTVEDFGTYDKTYNPKVIYSSSGNAEQGSRQGASFNQGRVGASESRFNQGGSSGSGFNRGSVQSGTSENRYNQGSVQSGASESRFNQGSVQSGASESRFNQGSVQSGASERRFNQGSVQSGSSQSRFNQGGGSFRGGSPDGELVHERHEDSYFGSGSRQGGRGQGGRTQYHIEGSAGGRDGSYEEHHETSYESRGGSSSQGSRHGGNYASDARHQGGRTQNAGGGQFKYEESSSGSGAFRGGSQSGSRAQGGASYDSERRAYEESQRRGGSASASASYDERRAYEESQRRAQQGGSRVGGTYGGQTIEDNVIQHGSSHGGRTGGKARGGYIDANGEYHSFATKNASYSAESSGQGSQSLGDFNIHSGKNFAEDAALGHGFTFNTLNVGGIQGHTEAARRNQGNDGNVKHTWHMEETIERSGEIPPTYFETVGRDNVPTDKPNLNNLHRGRRQASMIEDLIKCNSTRCVYIKCNVGTLEKEKEVSIALRSRINMRVLRELKSQTLKFSSMMVGRISKLPYIGRPREQPLHNHEIFTEVPAQESEIKPHVIPLWVVILSAVGGTLALLLIIYILYKCGFFKRNRPPTAPERQPLNRNGYNPGDEAL